VDHKATKVTLDPQENKGILDTQDSQDWMA
jgi:hypothetical protein